MQRDKVYDQIRSKKVSFGLKNTTSGLKTKYIKEQYNAFTGLRAHSKDF